MGYEINVSKNGQHYFATADRSIGHDVKKCNTLYDQLKKAFPEDEGYELSVTNWSRVGQPYDIEEDRLTNERAGERQVGEDYFNDGELDPAGGRGLKSHE